MSARRAARDDTEKREPHPLWDEKECVIELARAAAIFFGFEHDRGASMASFARKIASHAQEGGHAGEEEGDAYFEIRRLITFEHYTHKTKVLDQVADYLFLQWPGHEGQRPHLRDIFSRVDLRRAFADYRAGTLKSPFWPEYGLRETASQTRAFGSIEISAEKFGAASRYLTGEERVTEAQREAEASRYACYRYSVFSGHVAKSQFTFLPCTERDPIFRFRNTFRDSSGAHRDSIGIGFKNDAWIYLIGQLQFERAMKVLVVRATGEQPGKFVAALVMSKSVKPMVGKAYLERLDAPLSEDEIRVADERIDAEFCSKTFQTKIRPHIRNAMTFRLGRSLVYREKGQKDQTISQGAMVDMLPKLMKGKFYIKDSDDKLTLFNPASHDQYPFNQAIAIEGD